MTRFLQNRTAWAGLALLFLFITPITLVADEPGAVIVMEQQKAKEKQEREEIIAQKRKFLATLENIYSEQKNELRAKMDTVKRLSERLSYLDIGKEVQSKLIGNATQSLHEARTDIAVKEALIAHLEQLRKKTTPPISLIASAEAKIKTLEKQYQLVIMKSKARIAASKDAPPKEARNEALGVLRKESIRAEIEMEQIYAKLADAKLELNTLMEMAQKPITDKITALQTELVGLKVKEKITKEYLTKLRESASGSVDIEIMQNDVKFLQQKVQELQQQLYYARLDLDMPIMGSSTVGKKAGSGKGSSKGK